MHIGSSLCRITLIDHKCTKQDAAGLRHLLASSTLLRLTSRSNMAPVHYSTSASSSSRARSMVSTTISGSAPVSHCGSPRRNSFDFVVDTARTLEAEASAAEPITTDAESPERSMATKIQAPLPSIRRPFQQEIGARFGGYRDIELGEISPRSRTSIPGSAPRPLPTAHILRYSTMTGYNANPSPSCQTAAGSATRARPTQSSDGTPPSLLDDLMTVVNYFRKARHVGPIHQLACNLPTIH